MLARIFGRPWPEVDVLMVKTRTCPLCEKAGRILQRERRRLGLRLRVVDITDSDDLIETYGHEVPVVFVNDKKRFIGTVDPWLLRRTVEGIRAASRR